MLTSKQLTAGERLILFRRRSGLTKAKVAESYRISLYRYNLWEKDQSKDKPPQVAVGRMKRHEIYLILRLRAGLTRHDMAAKMGVTPWWLTQLEAGEAPVERLAQHWNQISD